MNRWLSPPRERFLISSSTFEKSQPLAKKNPLVLKLPFLLLPHHVETIQTKRFTPSSVTSQKNVIFPHF
jgi:hypothetical protein